MGNLFHRSIDEAHTIDDDGRMIDTTNYHGIHFTNNEDDYAIKILDLPSPIIGDVLSYLERSSLSFFAMFIESCNSKKEISSDVYKGILELISEQQDNTLHYRLAIFNQSEQLRCCIKAYKWSLSRCQHCGLNEVDSSILLYTCSVCNIFKYCSQQCRSRDWRKHKHICGNFIFDANL